MKGIFGSLIILEPSSPQVYSFRVTYAWIAIIALAGLISVGAVVAVGYMFPPLIVDQQARLERENQVLRTENKNLKIQADRLGHRVAQLEEISERISTLVEAD
jgi:hypothetical protein